MFLRNDFEFIWIPVPLRPPFSTRLARVFRFDAASLHHELWAGCAFKTVRLVRSPLFSPFFSSRPVSPVVSYLIRCRIYFPCDGPSLVRLIILLRGYDRFVYQWSKFFLSSVSFVDDSIWHWLFFIHVSNLSPFEGYTKCSEIMSNNCINWNVKTIMTIIYIIFI